MHKAFLNVLTNIVIATLSFTISMTAKQLVEKQELVDERKVLKAFCKVFVITSIVMVCFKNVQQAFVIALIVLLSIAAWFLNPYALFGFLISVDQALAALPMLSMVLYSFLKPVVNKRKRETLINYSALLLGVIMALLVSLVKGR